MPEPANPTAKGENPMATAPRDGTEIIVWWPLLKIPDELDAVPSEYVEDEGWGTFVVTKWEGNGWMEPPFCEAAGEYFGDDYEYAPDPFCWWPCPAQPVRPPVREHREPASTDQPKLL